MYVQIYIYEYINIHMNTNIRMCGMREDGAKKRLKKVCVDRYINLNIDIHIYMYTYM